MFPVQGFLHAESVAAWKPGVCSRPDHVITVMDGLPPSESDVKLKRIRAQVCHRRDSGRQSGQQALNGTQVTLSTDTVRRRSIIQLMVAPSAASPSMGPFDVSRADKEAIAPCCRAFTPTVASSLLTTLLGISHRSWIRLAVSRVYRGPDPERYGPGQ